jgi:hypothetical protein
VNLLVYGVQFSLVIDTNIFVAFYLLVNRKFLKYAILWYVSYIHYILYQIAKDSLNLENLRLTSFCISHNVPAVCDIGRRLIRTLRSKDRGCEPLPAISVFLEMEINPKSLLRSIWYNTPDIDPV